jgi:hypothetical protein
MTADCHGCELVGRDRSTPFGVPSTPYMSRLGLNAFFTNEATKAFSNCLGHCLIQVLRAPLRLLWNIGILAK